MVFFTIFSVFKDDLFHYFQENLKNQTHFHEEISSESDGAYVNVKGNNRTLSYNLDAGNYTIRTENSKTISLTPQMYVYEPKYKQSHPLSKK